MQSNSRQLVSFATLNSGFYSFLSLNTNQAKVSINLRSQLINHMQAHKLQLNQQTQSFLFDLLLYLSIMFLIRTVYFHQFSFIANGLMWSFTTLIVATWRMKVRGISWADLGLRRPESYKKSFIATVSILIMVIGFIVIFEMIKEGFQLDFASDQSESKASKKFGQLKDNWLLFFSIMPFILIQSALEELLDRGFLINWIEKVFSSTWFATFIAVVIQALIFGFRHSYDLSERSISVALIGLAMGLGYVFFGRNLWPLITAHCVLNTMSMIDRV